MSSDKLRSDFIEEMIAELMRQKVGDEKSFNQPQVSSSKNIFRAMCFDYPIVTSEELIILAQDVIKFASTTSYNQLYDFFWLNDKFLSNLVYLSSSAPQSDGEREKAIATLCAAVFLKLPLRLLGMSREELQNFFCGPPNSSDIDANNCNDYSSSIIFDSSTIMSWQEICSNYHRFVLRGTASLLSGLEGAALVRDEKKDKKRADNSRGHLCDLVEAIDLIRGESIINKDAMKNIKDGSMTLEECFLYYREGNTGTDGAATLVSTHPDTSSGSMIDEASVATITGMAKDLWLHLSFLFRDLMALNPETVSHSSALPALYKALLRPSETISSPLSSFPTSEECMFVLIFSGIINSISTSTSQPSIVSSNAAGDGVKDGKSVEIALEEQNQARIRARKCTEARIGLKKYLDSSNPSILANCVSICERISCLSTSSVNGDGGMILCDIVSLYISDCSAHIKPHTHERLMSARAVSALVQMWIALTTKSRKQTGIDIDSAIIENEFSTHEKVSATKTAISQSAIRIIQTISVLCFQRSETAAFILRIPLFLDTIFQTSQCWLQLSIGDQSGSKETSDCLLEPGDAIGLITGLLLAIPSPMPPSSSSSSSTSNYDILLERLQSALIIAESFVFPNLSTASAVQEVDNKLVAFIENDSDKKELLEKLEKRRHKASGYSKGLIKSLLLITSEEGQTGGGAANLRIACRLGQNLPMPTSVSVVSMLRAWAVSMLKNSSKISIEKNRIRSIDSPFTLNMVKKEKNVQPSIHDEETDVGSLGGVAGIREELSNTEIIDANNENADTGDEPHTEDEIEIGGHNGNTEELKRLIKALQAILEGFSTSKVD